MDFPSNIYVMPIVDHRGFNPLYKTLHSIPLDTSLRSDLTWDIKNEDPHIIWELDFAIQTLNPAHLASYQLAVRSFIERIWDKHQESTLGVILYKGEIPPFALEDFADYLHHIAAQLPDEVPPFALFNCPGDPLKFSKEIFPHIHLGFPSGSIGAIQWGERLIPRRYDAKIGVVLPLREKGLQFDAVDQCLYFLDQKKIPYRLIAEPYLTEEWDDLDEIVIFSTLVSAWGLRMIQGFEAAGGRIRRFGVEGFEPPTFCSQSRRASQAALYPEKN